MQPIELSKADSKVLAQVFDPESSPNKVEVLVDPGLQSDRCIHDSGLLRQLKNRERNAIAIIEMCEKSGANSQSKDEAYRSALAILDQLISEHPDYASARNNRAQLRRWRFGDRNMLYQPRFQQDLSRKAAGISVVEDLNMSMSLASPGRPQDGVSPSQGRLLAQTYTQLGAIYYAAFKDLDSSTIIEPVDIKGVVWSKERFEEEASRLFYLGGLYGNEVAKALAVNTNPHAKLCGSIVKEAMKKEIEGLQV